MVAYRRRENDMDKVFVLDGEAQVTASVKSQKDHFDLVGSGGGRYEGPGQYWHDEIKDRWRKVKK